MSQGIKLADYPNLFTPSVTSNVTYDPITYIPKPKGKAAMSTPATTIDPYTAARRLREILQELRYTPPAQPTQTRMRTHEKELLSSYLRNVLQRLTQIEESLSQMDEELRAGKTVLPRKRIEEIRVRISQGRTHAEAIEARVKSYKPPTTPANNNAQIAEAFRLAQCLPTVKGIPQTDHELTIRAICAVLRNHGVAEAALLTQDGEVSNGKETAATPEAVDFHEDGDEDGEQPS